MQANDVLTLGAALAFAVGPSFADVFVVTTRGEHAIKGKVELVGEAFAVSPNVLLTASGVVGLAKDFKAATVLGRVAVPGRTITIRDVSDARAASFDVTMGVRPTGGEVVVLIADASASPLAQEALSACPLVEGGTYAMRAPSNDGEVVGQLVVSSAGAVTRFTAGADWDPERALGAPVFGPDGRVAGVVTAAATDGSAVAFTPLADVVNLLPYDAEIACDPRVEPGVLAQLKSSVKGLASRISDAEADVRKLSARVAAAEATGNFAVDVLADVATDLEKINSVRASGGDISLLLESMKTRLQGLKLAPTVKTIDALLRRPDWSAGAKSLNGDLTLTFTYRTQLPGPGFSNSLRLCLRAIKPYKGSGGVHDFRTIDFYSKATTDDAARVVTCTTTNVNIPAGREDMGQFAFEISRDAMTDLFEAYHEANDWVPTDYRWSGLTYADLIKPGTADGAFDEVILHMLIVPPDESRPGALAVECKLFDNVQNVIDFLALDEWKPDETAFDDVSRVVLDPENTSDECVSASVQ